MSQNAESPAMKVMEGFRKLGDDLEKVIEKDDGNSSTTTESETNETTKPTATFREKVHEIIHTNKFQIVIIILVLLDCVLVIAELLIDLQVIEIDGEDNPAPHVLHYMSISILCIFLIELFFKLYAMRLSFFKHYMELFDAVIVIVSFVLDVLYAHNEDILNGFGLLVLLRLWRVTRVLNGIVLSVKAQAEKRLAKEKKLKEAVEQELTKFREYCTNQEQEIEFLQGLLRKHNIAFEQKEKPVAPSMISVVAEVNQINEADDSKLKKSLDTVTS